MNPAPTDAAIATAITSLLAREGLRSLLPPDFVAEREDHTLWRVGLMTRAGDSALTVAVYPLASRPETIVGYEEARAALRQEAPRPERLRLVAEGQSLGFGIVVGADADGARVLAYHRQALDPNSELLPFAYHPQLDRILGADYEAEVRGTSLRVCVMSLDHAEALVELAAVLHGAHASAAQPTGAVERAFPELLAVEEIDVVPVMVGKEPRGYPIHESFRRDGLAHAPPRYHRLAQATLVISDGLPLTQEKDLASAAGRLGRQLGPMLRCGHDAGLQFHRAAGTCLAAELLTTDGAMVDLHFLDRMRDGEGREGESRTSDLRQLLWLLRRLAGANLACLDDAYRLAVHGYLRATFVDPELDALLTETARSANDAAPSRGLPTREDGLVNAVIAAARRAPC